MKRLLRNKRKGYAHFSYMNTLQRPESNPNILTLACGYYGTLVKQSKAAKRLRKERAKPWKYLRSKGSSIRGKTINRCRLGLKEYVKNFADQINDRNKSAFEHMKYSAVDFFDEWLATRSHSPFIYSHSLNSKPKENP